MKLSADIVEDMRKRIELLDTDETRQAYREGRFPRADSVKDLDMRYRWDLFYASKCGEVLDSHGAYSVSAIARNGVSVTGTITSAHIDTALRRIVAPLGTV